MGEAAKTPDKQVAGILGFYCLGVHGGFAVHQSRRFLAFREIGRSVVGMRGLITASLAALVLGGCTLANLTPQARFSESAYSLNDAARWGQVDQAVYHVSPKYLERFTSRHREWGASVNIAEVDLVRMQLAEDRKSAVSEIKLSWFDAGGVTLRSSTVTQKWETEEGKFKLVDEAVRGGDPRVFADSPQGG